MKVLLIEDDDTVVESIKYRLSHEKGYTFIEAACRDDAMAIIASDIDYDIAYCDLRIPTTVGSLDADSVFGKQVFDEHRRQRPGTPIWVCSGYSDPDFNSRVFDSAERVNPFGSSTSIPFSQVFDKRRLDDLIRDLESIHEDVRLLGDISITLSDGRGAIAARQGRLLRIIARMRDGVSVVVTPLAGGLSGASVMAVDIKRGDGRLALRGVVKMDSPNTLKKDALRYRNFVATLVAGDFAPLIDEVYFGGTNLGAHQYSLAADNPTPLGDLVKDSESRGCGAVRKLREALKANQDSVSTREMTVKEVLSTCKSLTLAEAIVSGFEIDSSTILTYEAIRVGINLGTQHGDLHAWNILLDSSDQPILIDWGRASDELPASLDPVWLELGMVFHPSARPILGNWPSESNCLSWIDIDKYVEGCPIPNFIRECRNWADANAAGPREVAASGFAISMWQMKFPENRGRAKLLAKSLLDYLDATRSD